MIINHVTHSTEKLASFRYLCLVQKPYLEELGNTVLITEEPFEKADIAIFNKHQNLGDIDFIKGCKKRNTKTIFHVTDNHFVTHLKGYYQAMCLLADVVTCTVPVLANVIEEHTGRKAVVMPDPHFYEEKPARYQPEGKLKLCWFGHPVNLDGLMNIWEELKDYDLSVVTDEKVQHKVPFPVIPWGISTLPRFIEKCDVVIIPSLNDARKMVKSPNRMVDSIRMGRFVISDPLPCYKEFNQMFTDGVLNGLSWIKTQTAYDITERIKSAQNYIRGRYSPYTIAAKWNDLFHQLNGENS